MNRPMQIFNAPGDEDSPLLNEPSPWVVDRLVSIPAEQWWILLQKAKESNAQLGENLVLASGDTNPAGDLTITHNAEHLRTLAQFVEQLASRIEHGPILVPEPTEEIPEAFEPSEHARMLRNVAAVFRESEMTGEPYEAWRE
jgi:hypothetical protein